MSGIAVCSVKSGPISVEVREHTCGIVSEAASHSHAWHQQIDGLGDNLKLTGRGAFDGVFFPHAATLIPAGLPISWRVGYRLKRLVVELTPEFLHAQLREENGEQWPILNETPPLHDPSLEHFSALIQLELGQSRRPSDAFLLALAQMLRQHWLQRYTLVPESGEAALSSWFLVLRAYIDKNLEGDLNVERLAKTIDCSPQQLLRWMKRDFGTTPQQYVIRCRVDAAKRILANPALPLSDLALACGFSSQPHFTNVFKKQVGVTPGRFRELHSR